MLNIYTPPEPFSPLVLTGYFTPLPVLVWLHGGSFTSGSGTQQKYGPQLLVEK